MVTLHSQAIRATWEPRHRERRAAASGRWGTPVAGVMWPTVEGRATPCQRPQSKQVPPWRPRSSVAESGRVEMWRGGGRPNISVAASFVWRCLSGSAVTLFPHPAHQPEGAAEDLCGRAKRRPAATHSFRRRCKFPEQVRKSHLIADPRTYAGSTGWADKPLIGLDFGRAHR
jgi:hypothetical protein